LTNSIKAVVKIIEGMTRGAFSLTPRKLLRVNTDEGNTERTGLIKEEKRHIANKNSLN
jgi:hypothetical protein